VTALYPAAAVTAGSAPVLVRLSPTRSVILLRLADHRLLAWRNACPHMGIELDWEPKRLLARNGQYLQCTGHGALFRKESGLCVRGPCMGESLQAQPIRIEDDMVALDD
jgi:nitrite reductase/ring-hydroxylating ferredoxin subunit